MSSEGFLSHIEALRRMVLEILAIFVFLLIPGWYFAPDVLAFLQGAAERIARESGNGGSFSLSYFTLMEPFLVELKAGMLLALFAGLPFYLWRFWRFLAPALYLHEKRFLLIGTVAAYILFAGGFSLGIFGVMPLLVKFSVSFARDGLAPVIGFSNFVGLMMTVALAFGAMFELPVVLLALVMANIISLETLRKQRALVLVVILVVAAFLTPPDVISQLMLGAPVYILFELTLLAGRWIIKKKESENSCEGNNSELVTETEAGAEAVEVAEAVDEAEAWENSNNCYRRRRRRRSGSLPRRKRKYDL